MASLRATLKTQLDAAGLDPANIPAGVTLIAASAIVGTTTADQAASALVSKQKDTFTLTVSGNGTIDGVDQTQVQQVAAARLAASVPSGYQLFPSTVQTQVGPAVVNGGQISFSASATGQIAATLGPGRTPVAGPRQDGRPGAHDPGDARHGHYRDVAVLRLEHPRRHGSRDDHGPAAAAGCLQRPRHERADEPPWRHDRAADERGGPDRHPERHVSRLLGIDLGDRRIGLAVAATDRSTARGLATVMRGTLDDDATALAHVVAEQRIDEVVVGLPLLPSGDEGDEATAARAWAEADPGAG